MREKEGREERDSDFLIFTFRFFLFVLSWQRSEI